jgi:restriction endonuclease
MEYKIFDTSPDTWQDLEIMVQQAFDEMGYESHRKYPVQTVRGTVEIDVFAKKTTTPIPSIVLCECKHWNTPVSQTVIHGFRTVCSDIGAHYGLIVSKKGFQSGAAESRESTNIHLMTFEEFQKTFFREWREGVLMILSAMRIEILPIIRAKMNMQDDGLDRIDVRQLQNVQPMEKYSIFDGWEGNFSRYFINEEEFPIEINDPRGNPEELKRLVVNTHREYLEIAKQAVLDARAHFNLEPIYFENFDKITPIFKGKSPPPMD